MSKLAQLLSYLDREDVVRLRFRSGKPVMLQTKTREHAVTITPLKSAQIRKFFVGTELSSRLDQGDTPQATHTLRIVDLNYRVEIQQAGPVLSINVQREGDSAGERSKSRPASRPASRPPSRPEGPPVNLSPAPAPAMQARPRATPALARTPLRVEHGPSRAERAARVDRTKVTATDQSAVPKPVARAPSAPIESKPEPVLRPSGQSRRPKRAARSEGAQPDDAASALIEILRDGTKALASDIHVVADQPARIRRVGQLEPATANLPAATVEAMLRSVLELRHLEQLAARGYTDLAIDIANVGRFRVNVCRQRTGLKGCFRTIASTPPTVAELRMPAEVEQLKLHHQGLVVLSGPNGHGKTTSLAALVDMFNAAKPLHIITVEDPVEILHPVKRAIVTQREVGTHTRSFQAALAGALREDPDIIAIGELRDRETVEMALQAAETGHLVLATMSTPSGGTTIDRMIDMFPPDDQAQVRATLAGALKLILSQRLLVRADGKGLVAAFEMITGKIPLWTLIRDRKLFQLPSLMQRGRNYGMIRLEESLRGLVEDGTITRDQALMYAADPRVLG